jgi:hypothetical protein
LTARHHLRALLQERDLNLALHERLGQLQADVAGADDDRRPHLRAGQRVLELERVVHRVQQMHTRQVDARERWPDRLGPCRDDETVLARPVSKLVGVGHLPADQVGETADAVIRKPVGDERHDFDFRRELTRPHRGRDARVASADDHEPHWQSRFEIGRARLQRARRARWPRRHHASG